MKNQRCQKLSCGTSKAKIREHHRSKMKNRKISRYVVTATHRSRRITPVKPGWLKSIWPDGKIAKPGRMG